MTAQAPFNAFACLLLQAARLFMSLMTVAYNVSCGSSTATQLALLILFVFTIVLCR